MAEGLLSPAEYQYLRDHAEEANPAVWIPRLLQEIARQQQNAEALRQAIEVFGQPSPSHPAGC